MSKRRPNVTFDWKKDMANRLEHGWSLNEAVGFKFETALIRADASAAIDDGRFQALGKIGKRIVFLVFIPTNDGFRAISLRDARPAERDAWEIHHP